MHVQRGIELKPMNCEINLSQLEMKQIGDHVEENAYIIQNVISLDLLRMQLKRDVFHPNEVSNLRLYQQYFLFSPSSGKASGFKGGIQA